jgi:hypothetical protein
VRNGKSLAKGAVNEAVGRTQHHEKYIPAPPASSAIASSFSCASNEHPREKNDSKAHSLRQRIGKMHIFATAEILKRSERPFFRNGLFVIQPPNQTTQSQSEPLIPGAHVFLGCGEKVVPLDAIVIIPTETIL